MIIGTYRGDVVHMIDNNLAHRAITKAYFAQGCNCHIRQGSGIAGALRKFPEIFQADIDYGRQSDRTKLGEYSVAEVGENVVMYNMYTQFDFGTDKMNVDYDAIGEAFATLNAEWRDAGRSDALYIPLIGAGLAGGDWNIVKEEIDTATPDIDIIVIEFLQGADPRMAIVGNPLARA